MSGDAHMIGLSPKWANSKGGFVNFIAGPLDKTPSCKGGKYIFGPYYGIN